MLRLTPRRRDFLFSARRAAMSGLPHMAEALVEEATLHKIASYARAERRAAELEADTLAEIITERPTPALVQFMKEMIL
jgi:hypothetical protein